MRYIKTFENYVNVGVDADIEEICYDITDSTGFSADVGAYGVGSPNHFTFIRKMVRDNEDGDCECDSFYFDEVKEVCLRIKNYLGDKFVKISYDFGFDLNKTFDLSEYEVSIGNKLVDCITIEYKIK